MHVHHNNLILLLITLLCILAVFVLYSAQNNKDSENGRLIAIVNGTQIFAGDIDKITKMIDIMNLHQLSAEQLRKGVQKHEINNLLSDIKKIIIEQQIKKYGLTVSEQEVQSKINEMFANIDSDAAKNIIEKSMAMYEALQEWQKQPSKSDTIYNEKLARIDVKKDQWELMKIIYDTPEKLKRMQIPQNIEDMKKYSYESAKNDLLYQKLVDSVTKVTVTEDKVKEAYNLKYGDWNHDATFDEVKEKIRQQLKKEDETANMTTWLNEQYKNAKIEIKDSKYKEVLNILQAGDK